MKLQQLPSEFQKALPILEKIKQAGFEAYFVGGSVRDVILGRQIHDVDIATSSYPQETKQIFERTVDVGIEHGTVLVLDGDAEYEITTFRTEDVYVDFRRPESVTFVRSLEEDLKRRDFTVNAFALDDRGQVIDLFDGLSDLENKLLRAVGQASERFNEDALRIMRGLRFAATLDFDIESQTFEAMTTHAPLLGKISVERSFIEFDKLLMAPYWRKGIEMLRRTGAYNYLPNLAHTDDNWQSLLDQLDQAFTFTRSEQAWAAVLIALKEEQPKTFLKNWKTSVHFQKEVEKIVAVYQERLEHEVTHLQVYRYGKETILLAEQLRQAQALSVDFERIEALNQTLAIHDKHEIVVNGGVLMTELGFKPGPDLGRLLKAIEEAIVEGHLANEKEAIFAFIKSL
ncbi:CCA tRNA nucleotidyltransferase [Streptococcus plurextorum]|uniref:CCA tRNA nucleotidyltransferase n=1 Tax=Streptococcus plurextorum TaxID=456876 RepID=UPI0003FBE6A3|nr:CCA tRNA nucleotidyltransferase [Streptococcus plurextorum]